MRLSSKGSLKPTAFWFYDFFIENIPKKGKFLRFFLKKQNFFRKNKIFFRKSQKKRKKRYVLDEPLKIEKGVFKNEN